MAERRWRAWPDQVFRTREGEIPVVSREALLEVVLDGVAMLDRSGGVLTVVVGRQPTDLPGESVTTGAVVEWKNRTDAKAQPEERVEVLPRDAVMDAGTGEESEVFVAGAVDAEDLASDAEPDGLDPDKLEEEDLSSIPEGMR